MTRLIPLLVLCLALAAGLSAQGIVRSPAKSRNSLNKGANEAAKEAQNAANKARKAENRSEAEEKREAAKEAKQPKGEGPEIVLPEDGDDVVPEPGETVARAEKDTTIDDVMDMLKLTDKVKREQFKKNVLAAWEASEKEDKRYAPVYKKADTPEKREAARKEHQEKLKAIWTKSDEDMAKQKLLTEEQTKQWKKASEELRTKTATDIFYEAREKAEAQQAKDKAEKKPEAENPQPKDAQDK